MQDHISKETYLSPRLCPKLPDLHLWAHQFPFPVPFNSFAKVVGRIPGTLNMCQSDYYPSGKFTCRVNNWVLCIYPPIKFTRACKKVEELGKDYRVGILTIIKRPN